MPSDQVGELYDLGNELVHWKHYDEALNAFRLILAQQPHHVGALNSLGGVLTRLGRPELSLVCYDHALAVAPRMAELHINKGTALVALNRFDEATRCLLAAIAIEPERAEAHYNSSLVRLRLGDFAAWGDFEWRWRKADWADKRRNFAVPLWLGGEPIEGKTILLHAEQGLGDTIQFVRYVPLIAALGATVILESQAGLENLLGTIQGATAVFARGEELPPFDLHCPLLSLPLAFGTELATIPANIPYLWPLQERLAQWRDRMPANGRLRIGICWAGSTLHANDRNRSIPLARFAKLLSVPNLDFISVQKEVSESDAAILREHGVLQLGRDFTDFADTAAVVAMLDLVVGVDTSVVHLAGAMGKAVALLVPFSPDWRWLLDRTDSPWYPSMRIFRQATIGDWDAPLQRMQQELADVARRPAASTG